MERQIRELLEQVRTGDVPVERALEQIRDLPYEDLGFATLDHHRALRRGFPEVVFAEGKTNAQAVKIVERMLAKPGPVLATRVPDDMAAALLAAHEDGVHNELARTLLWRSDAPAGGVPADHDGIVVVSAGTSDLPVAEEAAVTAEAFGYPVHRVYDVGVAGLHRLLAKSEEIKRASILIVVAGMEGALPSVVGGLVEVPVIAVPTSVGYGASFGGLAALLAMLNSCASGVSVVNIDNGFGAGFSAALMQRSRERALAAARARV